MRLRLIMTAAAGAAIALLLLFAHASLPPTLGGETTYLRINGRSMLPDLVAGDLVGIRPAPPYVVGDVVAYRNPDLGIVVHRIVGWDGDLLVLRGDNNDSDDAYHAGVTDVLGTLHARLPGAARYIPNSPLVMPIALSALGVVAALVRTWFTRRRGNRTAATREAPSSEQPSRTVGRAVVAAVCGLSLIFVVLGAALQVVGRVIPATSVKQEPVPIRHATTLSYSRGTTVDPALAGFPVFRSDSVPVAIQLNYKVDGPRTITDPAGTIAVDAQVQLTNGWRKTIPVVETTPFTGTEASVAGVLQLQSVWSELDLLSTQTGIEWGVARVVFSPRIRLTGRVEDRPIDDSVGKSFTFVLDKRQMYMDEPWKADRLQAISMTRVSVPHEVTNTVPFLGWSPRRLVSFSNAILPPAALTLLFALLWDATQRRGAAKKTPVSSDPLDQALRHGILSTIGERRSVVNVESLDDLVATRGEEPVFLDESAGDPTYFVLRNDAAFLFRASDRTRSASGAPSSPADRPVYDGPADDVPYWLFPPSARRRHGLAA